MQVFDNMRIGTKLVSAFACVILITFTSSLIIFERMTFIADSTERAEHSHAVLERLGGMVTAMVNQETGLRGYLLTSAENYLEPYKAGKADFRQELDEVRHLTADNASQQARLVDLAALADAWTNEIAEKEISLMTEPGGKEQALRLVGTGRGKQRMDAIRAKIVDMVAEERSLLRKRADAQTTAFGKSRTTIYLGGILSVLAAALLCWLLTHGVARAITRLTGAMTRLASGDTATEVPYHGRGDEVGIMAKTIQVFKDKMIEGDRLRADQDKLKLQAEIDKKAALAKMADSFEASVRGIVNGVSSSAVELQASAQTMSRTAEATAGQSTNVAAASDQATANVQTVASATEELSSSISEISRQVTDCAKICGTAVSGASKARHSIQEMEETTRKINDVITLINNIAGQTNLLALNATIEAARAGDAGKGFAVVASEVKSLANQTARATDEIDAQIKAVQAASSDSARAIEEIASTIGTIDGIATSIASAVEQQGAATREIARNVQQAAIGTNEVSSNIGGVSLAAAQTGSAATQVLGAASELSQQSENLRGQVDRFLETIRAA